MSKYQFTDLTCAGSNTPIAQADLDTFEVSGDAYPTNRVLSGEDHGYAEEWAEDGSILHEGERRPARAIYLFAASECAEEAADYPWDWRHVHRVQLMD